MSGPSVILRSEYGSMPLPVALRRWAAARGGFRLTNPEGCQSAATPAGSVGDLGRAPGGIALRSTPGYFLASLRLAAVCGFWQCWQAIF
jgi:hypothetical protein